MYFDAKGFIKPVTITKEGVEIFSLKKYKVSMPEEKFKKHSGFCLLFY
jgi:hypothetical protein